MPRPLRPRGLTYSAHVGADTASPVPSARPLAPTRGSLDEKVTYAGDYLDTTTKLVGLGVLGYIFVAYVAPTFLGGATKTRSAYAHYKAAKKLPGHETASMATVPHAALEGPLGRRFPARIGPHT